MLKNAFFLLFLHLFEFWSAVQSLANNLDPPIYIYLCLYIYALMLHLLLAWKQHSVLKDTPDIKHAKFSTSQNTLHEKHKLEFCFSVVFLLFFFKCSYDHEFKISMKVCKSQCSFITYYIKFEMSH